MQYEKIQCGPVELLYDPKEININDSAVQEQIQKFKDNVKLASKYLPSQLVITYLDGQVKIIE